MQISEYFDDSEFACRCGCGFCQISPDLLPVLDDVRAHFGVPVIITSGCRCPSHNAAIGGAKSSYHTKGWAADIKIPGVEAARVYAYLESKYPYCFGLGRYKTWVHIDVRLGRGRWVG